MELRGIDISSWSHGNDEPIDFGKVKAAGYGFVMIKATQGTDYKNPYLAEDAIEANHHGLMVGCYHYAVPAAGNAMLQAKYAAAAVASLPLTLGVALDLEELGTLQMHELSGWAEEWLSEMNKLGHQAPFYTNQDYLSQLPTAPWGHKLWYASEHLPEYKQAHIWMQQTTENTHIDGVPGPVDSDVFYGVRGTNPPAKPASPPHGHVEAAPVDPTPDAVDQTSTSDEPSPSGEPTGTGS